MEFEDVHDCVNFYEFLLPSESFDDQRFLNITIGVFLTYD